MGKRVRFTGTTADLDAIYIGRDRDPGLYAAVESGKPVLGTVTQEGMGVNNQVRFDDSNIEGVDFQTNGWFVRKDLLAEVPAFKVGDRVEVPEDWFWYYHSGERAASNAEWGGGGLGTIEKIYEDSVNTIVRMDSGDSWLIAFDSLTPISAPETFREQIEALLPEGATIIDINNVWDESGFYIDVEGATINPDGTLSPAVREHEVEVTYTFRYTLKSGESAEALKARLEADDTRDAVPLVSGRRVAEAQEEKIKPERTITIR